MSHCHNHVCWPGFNNQNITNILCPPSLEDIRVTLYTTYTREPNYQPLIKGNHSYPLQLSEQALNRHSLSLYQPPEIVRISFPPKISFCANKEAICEVCDQTHCLAPKANMCFYRSNYTILHEREQFPQTDTSISL